MTREIVQKHPLEKEDTSHKRERERERGEVVEIEDMFVLCCDTLMVCLVVWKENGRKENYGN
jgi:hypothetical protein